MQSFGRIPLMTCIGTLCSIAGTVIHVLAYEHDIYSLGWSLVVVVVVVHSTQYTVHSLFIRET